MLGMVIEEICPIFAPPLTFFDPISSFAARATENLWENAQRGKSDQTKNLKASYRRVQTLIIW